jgi:arsenate reductase-like glutaredoxin family protein
LIDRGAKRFIELGLQAAQLTDTRWLEKLMAEPLLLRLPLVRHQNDVTLGAAPDAGKQWCGK